MLRNLHSGRAQRQHLRPGHQPTASNINGPYPPTGGVNGQTYTCDNTIVNGYYWGGVVFLKSGGVWSLYTHAETHAFDWAPWMLTAKNPILWAHLDTRVPASLFDDSTASIQGNNNTTDPRVTSLVWGATEVHNADGGTLFGTGSYNGENGWIQQRCHVTDVDSHGTGAKRAGLSTGKLLDPQVTPSFWFWFEDHFPASIGLDQFTYNSAPDNLLRWQIHGPSTSNVGYEHTDSPYVSEQYGTLPALTDGFHVFNPIDHQTYSGSPLRWHQTDKPTWSDNGVAGNYTNTKAGTAEANWKTSRALGPYAWAVKITWGYTTGTVQVWRKDRLGNIVKVLNYTGNVGPQVSDILSAGGVTTSYCNFKMDFYYYNQRAGWTQLVGLFRNLRIWAQGDTVLSNMGYPNDLSRATRRLQSAQSNSTPNNP